MKRLLCVLFVVNISVLWTVLCQRLHDFVLAVSGGFGGSAWSEWPGHQLRQDELCGPHETLFVQSLLLKLAIFRLCPRLAAKNRSVTCSIQRWCRLSSNVNRPQNSGPGPTATKSTFCRISLKITLLMWPRPKLVFLLIENYFSNPLLNSLCFSHVAKDLCTYGVTLSFCCQYTLDLVSSFRVSWSAFSKQTIGWWVKKMNSRFFSKTKFKQDTASNSINVKALLTHLTKVSPDGYWKDMVEKMLIPLDQANQELAYNFRDSML